MPTMVHHTLSSEDLRLDLDFGDVGSHRNRSPFAVSLDANRLRELIDAALKGLRVYELMALRRPGDLWAYVDVLAIALPAYAQSRWTKSFRFQSKDEQRLPLDRFDGFFHWMGDDTEPVDEAWRGRWDAEPTREFIATLFWHVQQTIGSLDGGDLLMQHEVRRIREGLHAYDAWPLSTVRAQTDWLVKPQPDRYSTSFYAVLDRMLGRPEVEAVAYRDEGDYRVLRSMCLEQRRRAEVMGIGAEQALRLSSLTNYRIDNTAWDSALRMYDEGIGWGDLYIEGDGDMGAPLRQLNGTNWQRFGRWVLSTRDLGLFEGYSREHGDGWLLYEALPDTSIPRPPRDFW